MRFGVRTGSSRPTPYWSSGVETVEGDEGRQSVAGIEELKVQVSGSSGVCGSFLTGVEAGE